MNLLINLACLVSLILIITIIGIKSKYFNLIIIFILAWTSESLIDYGFIPDHIPNILFIYVILIMVIKIMMKMTKGKYKFYTPGLFTILSLLSICFLSAIINSIDYLRTLFFIRYFILFYLFFLCILNADLKYKEIKKINKFIMFLLIIQIPVATLKWLILPRYGEFGQENFTGTYATHGGGLNLLIPLIAIGFILPMYANKNRKIFILLFLGFLWFSLIGAKRALFLVLPLFAICMIYLMKYKFKLRFRFHNILLITILVVITTILVVRLNPTLNPQYKVGGSFNLNNLINYTTKYTTGKGYIEGEYYATGRYAATTTMIKYLTNSKLENLLFGYGPGIALKSGLIENTYRLTFLSFGIEDGITGFIWLSAQIGILGTLSFLFFLFCLFKKVAYVYRVEKDSYMKIFIIGTLGVFLVFFFDILFYSDAFLRANSLSTIFYYLVAVALINGKNIVKSSSRQEHNLV